MPVARGIGKEGRVQALWFAAAVQQTFEFVHAGQAPALIFGLAAAVGATTDYEGGLATARKLGQLGLPRLAQCPQILIEFIESDRDPGGLGEIGVPVVAPAIANAMAAATGRRIRRLPLSAEPV